MKLKLEKSHIEVLKRHVEQEYPHEACGFFIGTEENDLRTVTELWPVDNVSAENLRRRFVINPMDYLAAERKAEANGMLLLGVYHSHPDHPAIPSEHDLASAQPFFSYVIANVTNGNTGDIRSYRLDLDHFDEEQIINEHIHSLNH